MTNTTVSLTLNLKGQQAQNVLEQLGRSQKGTANELLRTNRMLEGVLRQQSQQTRVQSQQLQQLGRLYQQNARSITQQTTQTNASLRTNQLLERVLEQQVRQSRSLSQQTRNQNRDYQLQINMLRQQVAAADRLRQQLEAAGRAHREIGRGGSGGGSLAIGAGVVGGTVAGGMVLSSALQKPREYDQALTYITATATAGQGMSTAERLKSRDTLNGYIKSAVRSGGGTRDEAANAANTLIASGKYDLKTVAPALNAATKTAFATGADANDAATLTVRMQDFGMTDLQKGHDIAVRGGQLGSFEYKDQAKWLAQQMAAAQSIGYRGEKGFIELVAMNQVAMKTAATKDEAGNNVVNLLGKLSSREFSDSISKAVAAQAGDPTKSNGKKKPKQVFDWTTYASQQREKGVYEVEAFSKLLDRQLVNNKQYQRLQEKLKRAANDADKKALLGDMANIVEGSELGKIIADRQALMAILAIRQNPEYFNSVRNGLSNSSAGATQADSDMVRNTEWAKDISVDQEKLFAQSNAYNSVSESLSNVKDKIVGWAQGNENLATSAYSATVALTALAAAGGTAALLKGGLGGGIAGRAAGAAAGGLASGGAATTAGQLLLAGGVGYGIGTVTRNMYMQTETGQKFDDKAGEVIAKTLAFFGNEDAKAAVEAQTKYEQMIAEQQRQTTVLSAKFDSVVSAIQNNKPVFNMPAGGYGGSSSPLLNSISQHAATEEKRHGAVPSYLAAK
ncbi:phage tail tape measure protein [Acinetobacter sp. ANC 5502]